MYFDEDELEVAKWLLVAIFVIAVLLYDSLT